MKHFLITFCFCLVALFGNAQEMVNGVLEYKTVKQFDGMSKDVLYTKALTALSNLAGSLQNSKLNIDVQDKETGLVVYKGQYWVGFHKSNMLYGYDGYADATIDIRCKDGRVQYIVRVPSVTFVWNGDPAQETAPTCELFPEYTYKKKLGNSKKAILDLYPKVPTVMHAIVESIAQKMATDSDDDF